MKSHVKILIYNISIILLLVGCGQQKDKRAKVETKLEVVSGIAEVNRTRLYYEVVGKGDPIVLIHGNMGDCRHWDDQFEVFAKSHKVLRYDVRGFGKSSLPIQGESYGHYDDLKELLGYLGISKAHIAGWSMGCGIAVDFVLAYPEMSNSLIAVGPWVSEYNSPAAEELNKLFSMVSSIVKESGTNAAVEFLIDSIRNPKVADRFGEICLDYSFWHFLNSNPVRSIDPPAMKQLERINLPTLIITAEYDIEPCREVADLLEQAIPNAKKVDITDASHQMHMEKPVDFNRIVLDFLSKINKK